VRFVSTDQQTLLKAPRIRVRYFVEIQYSIGPLYFTNARYNFDFNGKTYLGGGDLLDIDFPREDASLSANPGKITLSGLDAAALSNALNERTENRPVYIDLALFNPDTNQMLGTPIRMFRGTTGQIRITPPSSSGNG
jgi:hypothetical protein